MIEKIQIFETDCTDPYRNLAVEKYLLENVQENCCILYLWQNKNTVVIGRNQNAWAECRTTLLEQDGGKLARRLSGGGAVYHDLGNLNFTFLMQDENYDVDKQLQVIQTACRLLGIQAEKSGRNDLLVDGRKFSGNAFYHSQGNAYHHGTLMVDVDMERLPKFLNPPKAKLEAKGVASVRSRVVNLKEFSPGLTCKVLSDKMKEAFQIVYGLQAEALSLPASAQQEIDRQTQINGSWQWLYGPKLPFSFTCDSYFPWGHIQLQLQVESGNICTAKVYTDAMDWSLPEKIESALNGCRFSLPSIESALAASSLPDDVQKDICNLLAEQAI